MVLVGEICNAPTLQVPISKTMMFWIRICSLVLPWSLIWRPGANLGVEAWVEPVALQMPS